MIKAYEVEVYCDTIPNFPEEIILKRDINLCILTVPENIMNEWYNIHKKEIHEDIRKEFGDIYVLNPLAFWLKNIYTADGTEDLYEFCMKRNYLPGIELC